MKCNLKIISIVLVIIFLIGVADLTFASITNGTIDNTFKYAWSENAGWVNFGTTGGDVHITDAAVTGYAWSDNYGWINLSPTNSGVTNDGTGNLAGYAWGEGLGWIDFDNVSINTSGKFTGSASGTNSGILTFDCNNCDVRTDWRPRSARPACNNATDDDGDGRIDYPADPGCDSLSDNDETDPPSGGGMPSAWYNPPQAPQEGFTILINGGASETSNLSVKLSLTGGDDTVRMAISNFPDFRDAVQENYQTTKSWDICQGKESCSEGEYTIYVKFYTAWGAASAAFSDSIIYKKEIALPTKIIEKISEGAKEISEKIGEVAKKITEFFKPPEEIKPPEIPIEELVPKEAPLVLKGKWRLLTYTLQNKPFVKFTLAPLPIEFQKLAEKFPELEKTFTEVDVQRLIDIEKLEPVKLTLPGLTERVGLPTTKVEPGEFALPQGIPIAELSPEVKKQIPTEIVFAKTGGQLIDFNIALSVTEKGKAEQKITTISGKPLSLTVKPEKPVTSVKGYIIFKAKKTEPSSFQLPLNSFVASLFFANPIFAKEHNPEEIEEVLVLMEFEYTDPDGDGIYTADIQAPLVEGEYEIITVMDYEDPDLGQKEIRLVTVVDPEGYVYEKVGDKETRIPGAIISLFWLNPETKQYELWPAKEYHQENPQITDATGKYAFLVPNGSYYLKVEAPGYLVYDGKPFQVTESSGIHINIELKTKYWWLKIVDWKTLILILVVLLLVYNFYRDRMRERIKSS